MADADLDVVESDISSLQDILDVANAVAEARDEYQLEMKKLTEQWQSYEWKGDTENATKTKNLIDEKDKEYYNSIKTLQTYLEAEGFKSIDEVEKALGEKKKYKNQAAHIQKRFEMEAVASPVSENYDEEFDNYTYYKERKKPIISFGKPSEAEEIYDYINASEKKTKWNEGFFPKWGYTLC